MVEYASTYQVDTALFPWPPESERRGKPYTVLPEATGDPRRLHTMTWNCEGMPLSEAKPAKLQWLVQTMVARQLDIVCLQEITQINTEEARAKVRQLFRSAGLWCHLSTGASTSTPKNDSGQTWAPSVAWVMPLDLGDKLARTNPVEEIFPGRCLSLRLEDANAERQVHLIGVYSVAAPYNTTAGSDGQSPNDRAVELWDRIGAVVNPLIAKGHAVITMGDLNLSLSTKDKGGRKHKYPQSAVNIAEKAADLGMTNVYRSAHPDGGVPHTHRSQNPEVPDATIDYILIADKRRQVVRGASVDCHPRQQLRSDHAAVLAVLDVHAMAGYSLPGEGRGIDVRRITAEVGNKESDKALKQYWKSFKDSKAKDGTVKTSDFGQQFEEQIIAGGRRGEDFTPEALAEPDQIEEMLTKFVKVVDSIGADCGLIKTTKAKAVNRKADVRRDKTEHEDLMDVLSEARNSIAREAGIAKEEALLREPTQDGRVGQRRQTQTHSSHPPTPPPPPPAPRSAPSPQPSSGSSPRSVSQVVAERLKQIGVQREKFMAAAAEQTRVFSADTGTRMEDAPAWDVLDSYDTTMEFGGKSSAQIDEMMKPLIRAMNALMLALSKENKRRQSAKRNAERDADFKDNTSRFFRLMRDIKQDSPPDDYFHAATVVRDNEGSETISFDPQRVKEGVREPWGGEEGIYNGKNDPDYTTSEYRDHFKPVPLTSETKRAAKNLLDDWTVADVRAALDDAKLKARIGADGSSSFLLKHAGEVSERVIELMLTIFRSIVKHERYPEAWRMAQVVLLAKSDKKKSFDPTNHRPISCTCHMEKIFQAILTAKIQGYLENHDLLPRTQFGSRVGRDCHQPLSVLIDVMEEAIAGDGAAPAHIASVDIAKAFDTIPFQVSMDALRRVGVPGKIVKVVREMLDGRKATFATAYGYTAPIDVKSGVVQGTVIGPLLYLLATAALQEELEQLPGVRLLRRGRQAPWKQGEPRVPGEEGLQEYLREAENRFEQGQQDGGRNAKTHPSVSALQYVDDTIIVANSHEELQSAINLLTERLRTCIGIKLNAGKTVYVVVGAPRGDPHDRVLNVAGTEVPELDAPTKAVWVRSTPAGPREVDDPELVAMLQRMEARDRAEPKIGGEQTGATAGITVHLPTPSSSDPPHQLERNLSVNCSENCMEEEEEEMDEQYMDLNSEDCEHQEETEAEAQARRLFEREEAHHKMRREAEADWQRQLQEREVFAEWEDENPNIEVSDGCASIRRGAKHARTAGEAREGQDAAPSPVQACEEDHDHNPVERTNQHRSKRTRPSGRRGTSDQLDDAGLEVSAKQVLRNGESRYRLVEGGQGSPFILDRKTGEKQALQKQLVGDPSRKAFRYLGVHLTSDLSWRRQEEILLDRIESPLRLIGSASLTRAQVRLLVDSCVMSRLLYVLVVASVSDEFIAKVDRMISSAAKKALGLPTSYANALMTDPVHGAGIINLRDAVDRLRIRLVSGQLAEEDTTLQGAVTAMRARAVMCDLGVGPEALHGLTRWVSAGAKTQAGAAPARPPWEYAFPDPMSGDGTEGPSLQPEDPRREAAQLSGRLVRQTISRQTNTRFEAFLQALGRTGVAMSWKQGYSPLQRERTSRPTLTSRRAWVDWEQELPGACMSWRHVDELVDGHHLKAAGAITMLVYPEGEAQIHHDPWTDRELSIISRWAADRGGREWQKCAQKLEHPGRTAGMCKAVADALKPGTTCWKPTRRRPITAAEYRSLQHLLCNPSQNHDPCKPSPLVAPDVWGPMASEGGRRNPAEQGDEEHGNHEYCDVMNGDVVACHPQLRKRAHPLLPQEEGEGMQKEAFTWWGIVRETTYLAVESAAGKDSRTSAAAPAAPNMTVKVRRAMWDEEGHQVALVERIVPCCAPREESEQLSEAEDGASSPLLPPPTPTHPPRCRTMISSTTARGHMRRSRARLMTPSH